MKHAIRSALVLALGAALARPAAAQDDKPKSEAAASPAPVREPVVAVTEHEGTFNGVRMRYRATAGETFLKDEKGTPLASIVSYSYVKSGQRDPSRPVTFLWNGGPGSGSLWLQMGAFGPKRVALPQGPADDGAPPFRLIDNPASLLDKTDLVFIDPVGTGFSRVIGNTDPKRYWGVTEDAKSMAEFIRLWLNRNGRWNSPKYIAGESYGTTRSAAVVKELEGGYTDVSLNGVILISTILDFSAAAETPGNELAYILTLPSMAATAWYHDKVADKPARVEDFIAEARAFAIGPYAAALLKGNALPADERAAMTTQLARFTGLSPQFLDRADLRVSSSRFYKELLRDRGQVIGRLDARFTGRDYDNAGETPDNDPSFYAIDGAYTAAMNQWVREGLKYSPDTVYSSIGGVGEWNWKLDGGPRGGAGYLNVAPYIGKALRENSAMRVLVAQGYYDFATPFFGAEYSLSRTGIDPARVQFTYYHSGHMMYVRDEDLHQLAADVRAFIR